MAVPQLYNPVTSLLMAVGQKDCWTGMRTLGQLKQDLNIHNMPNKDSLYKVKRPRQNMKNEECILVPTFEVISSIYLTPDNNIAE